jgi:hypothetical protein
VDRKTALTSSVTVLLAFTGYVASYLYNLRLAQRKNRLERVTRQLSDLYGPLLALVSAGASSWIRLVDVVTNNAELLIEPRMPRCLLDACAHVATYQAVLRQWDEGDYTRHTSGINFPSDEILEYASASFVRLKAEQRQLLGGRAT